MSRSVMTADYAEHVFYDFLEYDDADDYDYADMVWQDYVEYITDKLERMYPSLYRPDRETWNNRECRVILENEHTEVTLSEYCEAVAICLAPRLRDREDSPLGVRWRAQVAPRIDAELSRLRRIGTFSNGEGVYEYAQRD